MAPGLSSLVARPFLIYLAFLLAGLACGLWPDWIFPPAGEVYTGPLPTLRTVAVAQAAFILLVWPVVAIRRSVRAGTRDEGLATRSKETGQRAETVDAPSRYSLVASPYSQAPSRYSLAPSPFFQVPETLFYMIATIPFYLAAAYLGDATARDVVRSAIGILLLWPVGWAAGVLVARPAARPAVIILMLIIALGLPAACYIVREFLTVFSENFQQQLWLLTPATFAWETAGARPAADGSIPPLPAWAALVWPILAIVAMLARLVFVSKPALSKPPGK
ncbi:MAG: hypothetical protein ACE15C_16360 [Phycisphaerae bacterium]